MTWRTQKRDLMCHATFSFCLNFFSNLKQCMCYLRSWKVLEEGRTEIIDQLRGNECGKSACYEHANAIDAWDVSWSVTFKSTLSNTNFHSYCKNRYIIFSSSFSSPLSFDDGSAKWKQKTIFMWKNSLNFEWLSEKYYCFTN